MDKFVAQQKRAVGTVVNLALNIVADVVGHHNVQIRVNRIGDGGTDGRFVVFAQQQFDCAVGRAAVQRIVLLKDACVSVSTISTLNTISAKTAAKDAVSVVLPVPPFVETTVKITIRISFFIKSIFS